MDCCGESRCSRIPHSGRFCHFLIGWILYQHRGGRVLQLRLGLITLGVFADLPAVDHTELCAISPCHTTSFEFSVRVLVWKQRNFRRAFPRSESHYALRAGSLVCRAWRKRIPARQNAKSVGFRTNSSCALRAAFWTKNHRNVAGHRFSLAGFSKPIRISCDSSWHGTQSRWWASSPASFDYISEGAPGSFQLRLSHSFFRSPFISPTPRFVTAIPATRFWRC